MKQYFLIISYEFPPFLGGAGTYSRELSVGLTSLGHEVTVLTSLHNDEKEAFGIDETLKSTHKINILRFKSIWKLFYFQLFYHLIKNFGKDYFDKFDSIILADHRATKFGMLFFKKALVKSVNVFHGGEIDSFYLTPNRYLKLFGIPGKYENMLFHCKANIAVSADLKNKIVTVLPSLNHKIDVVLHGIDTDLFQPTTKNKKISTLQKYNLEKRQLIILSASRLVKEKGQDNLIKAFSLIKDEIPNTKLIIAGDGNYINALKQQTADLQIQNSVLFTGNLAREELASLMGISDIFAMISRRKEEAFGLVFIEANACKVPVLAGAVAGVVEAVEDNVSGLLTDPNNILEVSDKLKKLILEDSFRKKLSESAYKRFKQGFTNLVMAKNTINLINGKG
ncbi:MAG: glycosyltransferase family 1 protein [Calditrichaeota bacterium]|nr:MAG: glycosyltransferase family 1 protein [Calditrichota bacterium]MBL1203790.1 glycosyltransferase family 1 protein [Calditrichota bacterium]NOG43620.1 glycosyltransferase family 4 protein [Calditrichota bacterium]